MTISTPESSVAAPQSVAEVPDYPKLGPVDHQLTRIGEHPKFASYLATAIAVLIGWAWISFQAVGVMYYSDTGLGPGMPLLNSLLLPVAEWAKDSAILDAVLRLCLPFRVSNASFVTLLVICSMWMAMSVAMMLPSAAPMLRTYGDIAQVARGKGEHTVPLVILACGYLFVWTIFAFAAAVLQMFLIVLGMVSGPSAPIAGMAGGVTLMVAGLYQFTSVKDACLEKCRNPFNTLFAEWTNQSIGVFKLGMQQGLFCVGCCWALMLVMLVVGTMNLAWMAFFTLFAIVEKSGKGKVTSHVAGGILLLWGGTLLALSFGFA